MAVIVRTVGDVSIDELSGEITLGRGVSHPLDLHGHRLEDLGQTLRELLGRGHSRIVLDIKIFKIFDDIADAVASLTRSC